ncbi:unnamed protein product [Rhizoctonia solani]|uniref:Uncharacterized protein n=1 Tax=Rhizoctonia solani TaxID=456999 RepID=A0A8H3GHT8_9AGAM|nr:unnamed protein product [Rhizoctonia solani]
MVYLKMTKRRSCNPKFMQNNAGRSAHHAYAPNLFTPTSRRLLLQMRSDAPKLEGVTSVEEMNNCLFKTACQESICPCMQQIAAEELANPMDIDDAHDHCAFTPVSRPVSPIRL